MTGPEATCPECDSRLQPIRGSDRRHALGPGAPVIIGGAILIALIAIAWLGFGVMSKGRRGVALGGAGSGAVAQGGDYLLRLAGSNTIGSRLGPDLVKAWLQSKGATDVREEERNDGGKPTPERVITARLNGREVRVEVRAHGSATAFTDLAAGTADIGMASRPIKADETEKLASLGDMRSSADEHVLGLDGVAVIVSSGNPLPKLSRADLQRMFSGHAASWREFGGVDRPIHLYARDDKSGTYDTFKELVLKGGPLGNAKRFEDSSELEQAVAGDADGIGFVALPYVKTSRAVPVSDGPSAALEPTTFSIKTENYPLSRRLFLYTAANPTNAAVKEFVSFSLSGQGQAVVRAAHFVDLDLTQAMPRELAAVQTGCHLSSRWKGNLDAYCNLRSGAEQLGTSFRFRIGSAELDTRAAQDLRRVLERMEQSPNRSIVLAGFADSSGSYAGNCTLSRSRAQRVASALKTLGLNAAETLGFCDELPVRDNATTEGREQNRRVEIFVR